MDPILSTNPEIIRTIQFSEWLIVMGLKLLAVFFLIGVNAFFVAAEFAIVKIRDSQLESLVKENDKRAIAAKYVIHHINPFLNTTQVGITLASLGLGWLGEPVFASLMEPIMNLFGVESQTLKHTLAFGLGFSVITFLHIILGECTPKTLSILNPLSSTLFVARPLRFFYKIVYPAVWALNESSIWLLKQLGLHAVDESGQNESIEEFRILLSADKQNVNIGRNILLNAIDLKSRTVQEIMIPRKAVTFLSTEQTIAECLDIAKQSRFSRFPVCQDGDLDQIKGILHIKDLYSRINETDTAKHLILNKVIFVPETAHLEKLLFRFLDNKIHMAAVVDEYGAVLGIVTQENILEKLVGQIQDESDQEQPLIQRISPTEWILAGTLSLHELENIIEHSIENDDGAATIGGFITKVKGKFPKKGQKIRIKDWELTVEKSDKFCVTSVHLEKLDEI